MNFVFPLGISKINSKGNEVNYNYYDVKQYEERFEEYIIKSIKEIIQFKKDNPDKVILLLGNHEIVKTY